MKAYMDNKSSYKPMQCIITANAKDKLATRSLVIISLPINTKR